MNHGDRGRNIEPSSPLAHLPTVEVERAAMDLRRGLPAVLEDSSGEGVLVAATELLAAHTLERMQGWGQGEPLVILTPSRAETLKIRLYTQDVVAVELPEDHTIARLQALADPAHDLDTPLKGPFSTKRTLPPWPLSEAVKLAKIAGLLPSVIAIAAPGDTAPRRFGEEQRLTTAEAAAIRAYDLTISDTLTMAASARLPITAAPDTRLIAFRSPAGGPEHYAILIGEPDAKTPVLTRLHSECFTGDLLGSLKCDCGDQLRGALAKIAEEGGGVLLYLAQEGRGIGLMNKLRAYRLQDQGFDTYAANERLGFGLDERAFQPAAEMLRRLGFETVRLMTNNPEKVAALTAHGITVAERVAHSFPPNPHNLDYLKAKVDVTGHFIETSDETKDV